MNINVDKINQLQKNDNQNYNEDVSLLASCEVVNHIAAKHRSSYRLSAGAKRMLILKRLDSCTNNRDFALLMRLLNDIDKSDTDNNSDDKNVTFTWATSAEDIDTKKDTKLK